MPISSGQYELNGLRRLDPQVIAAVVERYYPDVYCFVCYRVADETLAEKIAGDVFIRVIESVRSGRPPQTSLRAWLLGIAVRTIAEHVQHPSGQPVGKIPVRHPALTQEQQDVLALRFGLGSTLEEIAGLLKKSVSAVRQLQFQALAALDQSRDAAASFDDKLYEALETCLQAFEQGADIETGLARFPVGQVNDIRPILAMSVQARAAALRDAPAEALQRSRARVLRRAAEMRHQAWSAFVLAPLWLKQQLWSQPLYATFTSLATVTLVVAGGTGLAAARAVLPLIDRAQPVKFELGNKVRPAPVQQPAKLFGSPPRTSTPRFLTPGLDRITSGSRISGPGDVPEKKPEKKPDKQPKPEGHPGSGGNQEHGDHDHGHGGHDHGHDHGHGHGHGHHHGDD